MEHMSKERYTCPFSEIGRRYYDKKSNKNIQLIYHARTINANIQGGEKTELSSTNNHHVFSLATKTMTCQRTHSPREDLNVSNRNASRPLVKISANWCVVGMCLSSITLSSTIFMIK